MVEKRFRSEVPEVPGIEVHLSSMWLSTDDGIYRFWGGEQWVEISEEEAIILAEIEKGEEVEADIVKQLLKKYPELASPFSQWFRRHHSANQERSEQGTFVSSGDAMGAPVCVALPKDVDAIVRAIPDRSAWLRKAISNELRRDGLISVMDADLQWQTIKLPLLTNEDKRLEVWLLLDEATGVKEVEFHIFSEREAEESHVVRGYLDDARLEFNKAS